MSVSQPALVTLTLSVAVSLGFLVEPDDVTYFALQQQQQQPYTNAIIYLLCSTVVYYIVEIRPIFFYDSSNKKC